MKTALARDAIALLAGSLFGAGLTVSQMINPRKVLAFLDISGDWDPSLLLTMGGALVVTTVGYRFALDRPSPVFGDRFRLPAVSMIDARLVIGSALFGIGWGLAGYCPGPALSAVVLGAAEPLLFIGAMLVGGLLAGKLPVALNG
jgi:uncharacterized membrane protein YedE/YeeE